MIILIIGKFQFILNVNYNNITKKNYYFNMNYFFNKKIFNKIKFVNCLI